MRDTVLQIVDDAFPDAIPETEAIFDGGETHEVARVTFADRDPVVVKYTTDGAARLRRDRATLRYVARETSVPVPAVLALGENPPSVVLESLSGETTPQLRDFEAAGATDYLRTAGRLLGTLHDEATFDSPGRIEGTADGTLQHDPADSWPALYQELKEKTAGELTGTRFEDVAAGALDTLPVVTDDFTVDRPVLAHCDFGPNNVFRDSGDVMGIIDWEWCLAADPSYDLLRAERLFKREADDGTRDALLAGYRNVRPVPDEYEQRAEIYGGYETLAAMSSFDSWRPDDAERAREIADGLRAAVTDRLPVQ
jgi:Ser/Thr protein kinase RdoA (MazF antagonist)